MSDNINNGFPVPEEPLTREEQYLSAIAGVTSSSDIPEKPLTRIEAYLDKIVENGGGGGGGTSDYTQLSNKPKINNVELDGNKTSSDLGLQDTVSFEGTYNSSSNKAATMADIKDGKLTGYTQKSGNVAATDKVIEAIGKVEKKADDNQTNILNIQTSLTKLTPTVNGGVYNVSTTYSNISALTLNIPYSEGSAPAPIARISAIISIGNVGIRGIILSLSNDASNYDSSLNLLAKIEQDSGIYAVLKTDTINVNIGNADKPIYVWLKGADTGNVRAYSFMELLR